MSSSPTLRIPSPVPTSLAAPATIRPTLDPQSKVLQISAVVARIALSTIATVAAFVFLPLPFAIVATATLIVANVAICFCRCTSQPRNLERSGSFDSVRIDTPPPSPPSEIPFVRGNIPYFTGDWRALPVDRTLRPEPHTAVGGGHLVQDRSPVVRFSEPPAQLDTSHHPITVVYQGPAAGMPSFEFPSGSGLDMPPSSRGALASAAAPSFSSSLPQRASVEDAQLRNPQPPRTIVGGGHASELPSLGFPNGFGLGSTTMGGGAQERFHRLLRRAPLQGAERLNDLLSSRSAEAPSSDPGSHRGAFSLPHAQSATGTTLHRLVTPRSPGSSALSRPPVGQGYRTLVGSGDTGPKRRFAISLSAAAAAAATETVGEELSDSDTPQESLLPGAIPE